MTDYIKYFPKPFLDDLVQGRCVPFIGAGFSKNADIPSNKRMPLWDELGRALSDSLQDYEYSNAIDALSAYSYEFSRVKLIESLHEHLLVDSASPGETHKSFCNLHFELVVTTNLEFLLERGYESIDKYCHPIIDENQLAIHSKGPKIDLLKLHGDIHHPNRLVAEEKDYDSFLDRYPLLATFLANLLISKTALFIGYSFDDPDFRQVWQIIGDRLGKLRRAAYTIMVDAPHSAVARFERRGVKVINLPGEKKDYPRILANVFRALRSYWSEFVLKHSTTTKDESLAELTLPSEGPSRICFVAVPLEYASFYKENLFPIAYRYGFTPVLGYDIVSPGDNITAKITSFIERSGIVIVDLSSASTQFEARMAIKSKSMKEGRLLFISEEKPSPMFDLAQIQQVIRPSFPFEEVEEFRQALEVWFENVSHSLESIFEEEPQRLLRKREYRAAVVSAFALFEHGLRTLSEDESYYSKKGRILSITHLLDFATDRQIIENKKEYTKIREATRLRNALVHSAGDVKAKQAKDVVKLFMELTHKLKEFKSNR